MARSHSNSTIRTRIAQVLRSRKLRRENRSVLAVLALVVVVGVAAVLMQHGLAKRYTMRVLDCHYIGNVAHTHNQDCFDEDGNLVCPLRERELHSHTEDCYDDKGNLICGKEELLEEHIHGDGCFVTIAQGAGDSTVTYTGDTDSTHPEQTLVHTFEDPDGKMVMRIEAIAPEGALPKEASMEATWLSSGQVDKSVVQKAVSAKTGGKLLDLQGVDIAFFDAQHKSIQPSSPVTVVFTARMLEDSDEEAQVVRIESESEAAARAKDAEDEESTPQGIAMDALDDSALVREGLQLGDDQVAVSSDKFSNFVLALVSSEKTWFTEGAFDNGSVQISAPASAGVPQNAAFDLFIGDEQTDEAYGLALVKMNEIDPEGTLNKALLLNLTLKDGRGDTLNLGSPVNVTISLADASAYTGTPFFYSVLGQEQQEIAGSYDAESGKISFQVDDATSSILVVFADTEKAPTVDPEQPKADDADQADEAEPTVVVPDVRGLSYGEAKKQLSEVGLTAKKNDVDSSQEKGIVAGQNPTVGSIVPVDSEVTVDRSNGAYATKGATRGATRAANEMYVNIVKQWETADGTPVDPSPKDVRINIHRLVSTDGQSYTEDTGFDSYVDINAGSNTQTPMAAGPYPVEENGNYYMYYAAEDYVPDGYEATFLAGDGDEYVSYHNDEAVPLNILRGLAQDFTYTQTIVNKPREMQYTTVTARKTWNIDSGGTRHETTTAPANTTAGITVMRLVSTDRGATYTKDNDYQGETATIDSSHGSHQFQNLPVYSNDWQKRYKYYVVETSQPDGYHPYYYTSGSTNAVENPEDAASDRGGTIRVMNDQLYFLDAVPVIKDWPDFADSKYDWKVGLVLEKAYYTENNQKVTDFAPINPNDVREFTKGGTLVYENLPEYTWDAEHNRRLRIVYAVDEVYYEVKENGTVIHSWNESSGTDPDYAPVFMQDAGDPEVSAGTPQDWYQIILSNAAHVLGTPTKEIKISLDKTWDQQTSNKLAKFELVRYVQESYRNWSGVENSDYNDKTSWKPAQLTFNGTTQSTIDVPNKAPVYVAVKFKRGAGNNSITFNYTDLDGNPQSVTVQRPNGADHEEDEVWTSAILAQVGASGVREITIAAGDENKVQSVHLMDISPSSNTPVEDTICSIDTMTEDTQPAWHLDYKDAFNPVNDDDDPSNDDYNLPLQVPTEMTPQKTQVIYNYSYYIREVESRPMSDATFTDASGNPVNVNNRIDAYTPVDSNGKATVTAANESVPLLAVRKNWIDVQDTSGYPTSYFTLKYWVGNDKNHIHTYEDPRYDKNAFVDIPLGFNKIGVSNGGTWVCPVKLPTHEGPQEIHYFVEEKSTNGGSIATTNPQFNNVQTKIHGYTAQPSGGSVKFAKYDSVVNEDCTIRASQTSDGQISGEFTIRNEAPVHNQMDMLKKKWIQWVDDGSGNGVKSLRAVADANEQNCFIRYKIMRRALEPGYAQDDTIGPYVSAGTTNHVVSYWENWYMEIIQGYDGSGNNRSSVSTIDFSNWQYSGDWHWTIVNRDGTDPQSNGGIEFTGFRIDRREGSPTYGQIIPVEYQYIFIEIGCYKDWECTQPFDNQWDYYAIVPAAWAAKNAGKTEVEIFPKIVAQDQDRIVNMISSNMKINKDWGDQADDADVQEIYVKVYRTVSSGANYSSKDFICNFQKGGKPVQDVVNYSRYETSSLSDDPEVGILEDMDRFVNFGTDANPDWYLRMSKNEAEIELRRLPLAFGDQATNIMDYWAKEVCYKDASGNIVQIYNNLNQADEEFNPDSAMRPYYYSSKDSTRQYDPYNASFQLAEKNTNFFHVDNTPDRKSVVLKRWLDETGDKTEPWDSHVKFKIQRQAQRYVNVGDVDAPSYVRVGQQGAWTTNSGGGTTSGWQPQVSYDPGSDFYYNDTSKVWGAGQWEDVKFNGSEVLDVSESPKAYRVFYPHTGGLDYTITSQGAPTGSDPTPSDPEGLSESGKWYDVIDGLQNSYWETYLDNGTAKSGFMYKYRYRVVELEPSGDSGEAYTGTSISMTPNTGVFTDVYGRDEDADNSQVTIDNEKSSVKIYKQWLKPDGSATDPNAPIDTSIDKIRLKVMQITTEWTKRGTRWQKSSNDPTMRELTFEDSSGTPLDPNRIEVVEQNKIITVALDTSDTSGKTYKITNADDLNKAVEGHANWSLCIGGLDDEEIAADGNTKKTFTYMFIEDKAPAGANPSSAEQALSSDLKTYKTTYDSSKGFEPFADYADPSDVTKLEEFYRDMVEANEGAFASVSGTAGIKNKKISFNVIKKWIGDDGTELSTPWDYSITKVEFEVKQNVQKMKLNASGQWVNDGAATSRTLTFDDTANKAFEIVNDNKVITVTADASDPTKFTTSAAAATEPIAGREHWADRIDGLPIESDTYEDSGDTYKDVYTYEITEKNLPNAITTYARIDTDGASHNNVKTVSDGETMQISNKTTSLNVIKKWFNPDGTPTTDNQPWDADPAIDKVTFTLKQKVQKWNWDSAQSKWVKDGDPTERDIAVSDTTNVAAMTIRETNKYVYVVPTNTARDEYSVGIYESLTVGNTLIDGNNNWALRIDGLDHEKIDGTTRETYSYVVAEDAIANTITTYDPDTATVEQGGSVTINNRKNPLEITVEKEFTGLATADILDNGALKSEFRGIKLTLTNMNTLNKLPSGVDAKVFDATIGDLLDAGILTLDPGSGSTPTVKVSALLKPDARFFVRDDTNGTFYLDADGKYTDDASQAVDDTQKYRETTSMLNLDALIDGETYKLSESDYTLDGFQRDSSAATEATGTPDADGKLTLALGNPYKKIKITIEKQFQGIDDLFDGVTTAKIKDSYDSLSDNVKRLLSGITLTLKNTTDNKDVISGTIKDLVQAGVLTFDGSAFKVTGEITKDTPGVTVDAITEGAEYQLTETGADAATAIPTGFIYKVQDSTATSEKKTLDANATLTVGAKNVYEPFIDIVVYKVEENAAGDGPDTSGTPLAGATFTLEKGQFVTDTNAGTTTWNKDASFNVTVDSTSTAGVFDVKGLKAGDYRLIEHNVPDGHIKNDFDTFFRVSYDDTAHKLVVTEITTDETTGKDTDKGSEVVVTNTGEVRIYVSNPPGEELPHSGGPGTIPFTVAGVALLASASLYLLKMLLSERIKVHKNG